MRPDEGSIKDLVLYRLETAKDNIESAKILFEAGKYKDSNNRAYYAVFHSITAVQAMNGQAYKRHKDAIANFNKDYVKTEIFPHEIGRRISRCERIRNKSDYDEFYIASKDKTEEQIQTAEDVLKMVKEYCESRNYGLRAEE